MVAKTARGKHCEQEVIREYEMLREKHGEVFNHISRKKIYEDISENTDYSISRVGIIVNDYLRGKIKVEH